MHARNDDNYIIMKAPECSHGDEFLRFRSPQPRRKEGGSVGRSVGWVVCVLDTARTAQGVGKKETLSNLEPIVPRFCCNLRAELTISTA